MQILWMTIVHSILFCTYEICKRDWMNKKDTWSMWSSRGRHTTVIVLIVLAECPYYATLPFQCLHSRVLLQIFSSHFHVILPQSYCLLPTLSWLRRIERNSSSSFSFSSFSLSSLRGTEVCFSIIIASSCHLPSLFRPPTLSKFAIMLESCDEIHIELDKSLLSVPFFNMRRLIFHRTILRSSMTTLSMFL